MLVKINKTKAKGVKITYTMKLSKIECFNFFKSFNILKL